MGKNVLIVTSSVRKSGNSATLANAFSIGLSENGNKIQTIDASSRNFSAFRDVENAWRKGKPSLIEDDFNVLAPYLHISDILVLATPIYFGGFPASIKLFIDNLYAYTLPQRRKNLKFQRAVLLAVARDNEEDTFSAIIHEFKQIVKQLEIPAYDILCVPGVHEIGDIDPLTEELQKATDLGKSII